MATNLLLLGPSAFTRRFDCNLALHFHFTVVEYLLDQQRHNFLPRLLIKIVYTVSRPPHCNFNPTPVDLTARFQHRNPSVPQSKLISVTVPQSMHHPFYRTQIDTVSLLLYPILQIRYLSDGSLQFSHQSGVGLPEIDEIAVSVHLILDTTLKSEFN